MERYRRALYINLVSFAVLVPATVSGVVLWLYLPGGRQQAGLATFWALSRQVWIDVHLWTSVLLIVLIGGHLLLHLAYIENVPALLRRR